MPGVSAQQHPLPFHCPFDHVYDLEKWVHSDACVLPRPLTSERKAGRGAMRDGVPLPERVHAGMVRSLAERPCRNVSDGQTAARAMLRRRPFREYSFLNNSRISPSDRRDRVRLGVRGAADRGGPLDPQEDGRLVLLRPGDTYADAAAALRKSSRANPYVVEVSARSLELLCEDLGSAQQNTEFNTIMHTVLGVAEQVRVLGEHLRSAACAKSAAFGSWYWTNCCRRGPRGGGSVGVYCVLSGLTVAPCLSFACCRVRARCVVASAGTLLRRRCEPHLWARTVCARRVAQSNQLHVGVPSATQVARE